MEERIQRKVEELKMKNTFCKPSYESLREEAIQKVKRCLDEYVVDGIKTTIPLHRILADDPDMRKGDYDIHWLEKRLSEES